MDITDKLVEDQNYLTAELAKLKEMVNTDNTEAIKQIEKLENKIQEDQAKTYEIWDFLQFQDITTQQIEYAYNLIKRNRK